VLESNAIPLLPLLVLAAGSVVLMAAVAIRRSHAGAVVISLVTLGGAFGSVWAAAGAVPARVTPLLIFDSYALFYIGLITAAGIVVSLLAYGYLEKQGGPRDEFYLLLLLATLGGCTLVASSHFASFFLGLEILSVSLYCCSAWRWFMKNWARWISDGSPRRCPPRPVHKAHWSSLGWCS
jgi:NADH-quinone oxidoreductase subunit N